MEGYTEEDMINKLIVYHRHFEGILDCFKAVAKTVNADQPKADVFSQGIMLCLNCFQQRQYFQTFKDNLIFEIGF